MASIFLIQTTVALEGLRAVFELHVLISAKGEVEELDNEEHYGKLSEFHWIPKFCFALF